MKIKNLLSATAFCAISALSLSSCSKKEEAAAAPTAVNQEALSQIKALGFGTDDVRAVAGGYVVEGDMLLTKEMLASAPGYGTLRVGAEEQYRTTELVTAGSGRTLTVSLSSQFPAAYSSAIDVAIARYNAANLTLKMSRVANDAPSDLPVKYSADLGPGVLGQSGGFPTNGNPAPGFTLVPNVINSTNANYIGTIMAHEMGHCIGMRHTDYYNRQYSCGGRKSNEGASTVGAILIPGTPSLAEPNSWMLACVGNGVDRPFTANDLTALTYLY
ncbi:M57 family metalloprotease [Hymenobacter sp. BT770]|uniref:M57 family metalloprotease n=1 Tax=Hymenobacter sp. BT770 TaxID=2886942 RepID=UPI001D0FB38A|nr:M57 family metalloprotease [Hymenobacter sp. BT770]MCC3153305.1 zinc-dependent metalloprotease [Hymenobacter sp. BT770]MDO3414300.1 M57 family metalloprotease [Hymenobacter sp. BT770]